MRRDILVAVLLLIILHRSSSRKRRAITGAMLVLFLGWWLESRRRSSVLSTCEEKPPAAGRASPTSERILEPPKRSLVILYFELEASVEAIFIKDEIEGLGFSGEIILRDCSDKPTSSDAGGATLGVDKSRCAAVILLQTRSVLSRASVLLETRHIRALARSVESFRRSVSSATAGAPLFPSL